LNQVVSEHINDECPSITSPGFLIIGLSRPTANASCTKDTLTHVQHTITIMADSFLACIFVWVIQRSGFYTCPYPCKLH